MLSRVHCGMSAKALSEIQVVPTRGDYRAARPPPILTADVTATLAEIFLSNRRSIIWTATRIVRDAQAAEDVAQETFIRAKQAMERGPIEHVEAFLHQTARNLAIDFRRRRDMHARIVRDDVGGDDIENIAAPVPSPEASLIHAERLRLLQDAIRQLPERTQKVWYLNRVEKWSYPKIAEHLGVSPGTVFNDFKLAHGHCVQAMARIDRG